jgi:site-specific DNA recombinase
MSRDVRSLSLFAKHAKLSLDLVVRLCEPCDNYKSEGSAMRNAAVVYARVSTDEQAQSGLSLDMQIARCAEYAASKGFTVIDTVVDAGYSAKDTNHRPGMSRIMEMISSRKVSHLVAFKLDRLFRNTVETLQAASLMAKKGCEVHIVSEHGAMKADSADDEFLLTLKAGLAQRERKVVSERTKAALGRKRERGEFCGGEPPYGYKRVDEKLIPALEEQAVIRKILRLRKKGYSIRRIVKCLAEDGHLNRRGNHFQPTQVARILQREAA